jgi:hypothetical protein
MTDDEVKELLRASMRRADDIELKRDLWPEMRSVIDARTIRVSTFDWALIAAVITAFLVFPEALIALLYHL